MTATRAKARTCSYCGSCKKARWPKNDPHYCSKTCAANAAYQETSQRWCDTHGDWYHEDDGCYACEQEGNGGDTGQA